ncbi:hypothetical protein HYFRA_00008930 [Hymenoscyphus fraxineus]|uniref:Uncharacterized protein n=1 Tax=Hymenoscyphus fraxineus TaxID=746836 RepID=A0A9N9PRR0_9HELO|nr:hypothetical protein HYFRA_00008930 [Hymenoscyphus fraxineus]
MADHNPHQTHMMRYPPLILGTQYIDDNGACHVTEDTPRRTYSERFVYRYSELWIEYEHWVLLMTYQTPTDIKPITIRQSFTELVTNEYDFIRYCTDTDEHFFRRGLYLSRKVKESFWARFILKRFNDTNVVTNEKYIGAPFLQNEIRKLKRTGYEAEDALEEVNQSMRVLFSKMISQVTSQRVEDYWAEMKRTCPQMNTDSFELFAAQYRVENLDLERSYVEDDDDEIEEDVRAGEDDYVDNGGEDHEKSLAEAIAKVDAFQATRD